MNYTRLNEGQQAEEYLKRKQEAIDKAEKEREKNIKRRYVDNSSTDDIYKHISNNPKYREINKKEKRYEELKQKYPDAIPNRKFVKKDAELAKKRDKEKDNSIDASNYASRMVDNYEYKNYYLDGYERAMAADAARRHYRRHHKNESCGIFESVRFIDE